MPLSDTDPAFYVALAADPFLQWHYQHAATPWAGQMGVIDKLLKQGPPPNNPNTESKGSERNVPGVFVEGFGPFFGVVKPGLLADLEWFLREEELWRGFGTPPMVPPAIYVPKGVPLMAFEPDGSGPILNEKDETMPVWKWDILHLTVTQLACMVSIFTAAGRIDLAKRAQWQIDNLMMDVCATYALVPWTNDNQRANGYALEMLAIWIKRSPTSAPMAYGLLQKVIDYLWAKHKFVGGIPIYTYNATAAKSGDHKQPCSNWMNSRIVVGLDTLGSVVDWDAPYFSQARELLRHGGFCIKYAMDLAAANGGPVGSAVDDYGTDGTYNWNKPKAYGVMDVFWWAGAKAAQRRFPEQFTEPFAVPLQVAYEHKDPMRWWDKNFKTHPLSVCPIMAHEYGWLKLA